MSESEWVSSVSKHSLPQHMPSSRTRAEKYQGKGQKWKETEWFSFPLALYMKNVRSKKHLLPPMYLSAHFQEAWPHPGHRLAREQSLTQHIRKHRSPRLGGLLLFLWLNSQAGRAGTAPNDSWVLQSHTGPHRQASAPSPHRRAGLLRHILLFADSSDHKGLLLCVQRATVVKHTSPGTGWGKDSETSHSSSTPAHLSYHSTLPHKIKTLLENPAFRDVWFPKDSSH